MTSPHEWSHSKVLRLGAQEANSALRPRFREGRTETRGLAAALLQRSPHAVWPLHVLTHLAGTACSCNVGSHIKLNWRLRKKILLLMSFGNYLPVVSKLIEKSYHEFWSKAFLEKQLWIAMKRGREYMIISWHDILLSWFPRVADVIIHLLVFLTIVLT